DYPLQQTSLKYPVITALNALTPADRPIGRACTQIIEIPIPQGSPSAPSPYNVNHFHEERRARYNNECGIGWHIYTMFTIL
ncbi:MAG: hypothetical protein WCF57_00865, partial [Pyrinomonadaceae bacterium]